MRIDLHVHSSERSNCGQVGEEKMIQSAVDANLNAIIFTDHERLVPKRRLNQLNKLYAPFRIFGGIEISIKKEHLLVLGIYDKKLETTEWTYPKLHAFCQKKGGFLALAHPFRFSNNIELDIKKYPLDAVELYSANTPQKAKEDIEKLAEEMHIPKLSNSDAHVSILIGKYYNILDRTPHDEEELIKILKKGEFTRAVIDKT